MHRCKASYRQSNSKVRSPVLMLKCNATDIRSHAVPAPSCSRLDSVKNNALDHTPTSWTQGHIANHLTKITTNARTHTHTQTATRRLVPFCNHKVWTGHRSVLAASTVNETGRRVKRWRYALQLGQIHSTGSSVLQQPDADVCLFYRSLWTKTTWTISNV